MAITCNPCGQPVKTESANADNAIAKCEQCNVIFEIGGDTPA